jgi:hypothetical protein
MGHIEYLLGLRKPKPEIQESGEALPDLPGLNRREQQDQIDQKMNRKLYTQAIRQLRETGKKHKATQDPVKKAELARTKKNYKVSLDELLSLVGPCTDEERKYGFKEHGHGF